MMKRFGLSLMALSLLCVLTVGTAVASEKSKSKTVTFTEDVTINDTVVKKGTYQLKFDAKAGELLIHRDGDVVSRTKVTVEMRDQKALHNSLSFSATEKGKVLSGITFEGDKRVILLTGTGTTPAGEGN